MRVGFVSPISFISLLAPPPHESGSHTAQDPEMSLRVGSQPGYVELPRGTGSYGAEPREGAARDEGGRPHGEPYVP